MRLFLTSCLIFFSAFSASAQKDGYQLKINFKHDVNDEYVYLAHYYVKPLPTIYKTDSAKVINKRSAVISSKDSILGGIYMVLFDNMSKYTEFILDNGDAFEIQIDTANMPANVSFKNSPENERYLAYEKFLLDYGKKQQALSTSLAEAKNAADTQAIREESKVLAKALTDYRKQYAEQYPNTFLSNVFNALRLPEVPEGTHYQEDGKTVDSNFSYTYYKNHYWDYFNLKDNRLMFTPIFDARLDEYFNKLVIPFPDSVNAEADAFLERVRPASEVFKYSLYWLARNAENSKIMGMDEVFVHLVENYYMKGDAFWLDSATLAKYEDRAKKIAPNVIGNIAPDIILQSVNTLQDKSLHSMDSKYTLLIFWSPECGHCLKEIPQIDSLYRSTLKDIGVQVYSVITEGELSKIQETINKLDLGEWTNVVDAHNKKAYKSQYDVFSTPKIYLLDADKKIIGKGLDHSNILEVIDWVEKKQNVPH